MSRSDGRLVGSTLLSLIALLSLGCVENALREGREPMDYTPTVGAEPPKATDGGIYRGDVSSGSFLFYDAKARGVGDLVTVRIVENNKAEGAAKTDLESQSTVSATLSSDVGIETAVSTVIRKFFGLFFGGVPAAGAAGSTVNIIDSETTNDFEGQGKTSRSGNFTGMITCKVIAVLPGRVFHIRGKRSVIVNHDAELIMLEGLVRQQDIGLDNSVLSTELAELRLSYDGLGVVDDKQRPGWGSRLMAWLYPF